MSGFEQFERDAAAARGEPVPEVDVADRVIRSLRYRNGSESFERGMALWAGLSLAAASVVFVFAYSAWTSAADPMSGLFDSLTMVMR